MAILSALVFYVIPGMLGRSYDLKNETVGPDIFDKNVMKQARKIERYMTTSEYRLVSDSSEASEFLDVSGKFNLKLKIGAARIDATGNYLKEAESFDNNVDLLVKVHYETVIFTLPSTIQPLPKWEDSVKNTGYTHYIRSIKYGGDLIASLRFVASNRADKELIRGEIEGELNAASGSFGGGLKGNLEKIQSKLRDTASMDISYYATVPLENIPRTIDGLTSLVEKFPEQTRKVNNGYGVPLSMEVFSLEGLNKDAPVYYQTLALEDQMEILNALFTDIRNAKARLADWLQTVPPILEDNENKKISNFYSELDRIDEVFCKVIANLDLSHGKGAEQFEPAFQAYQGKKTVILPDMYVKELSRLKKEVLDNTPSIEADFGGSHFNYWGSEECPSSAKEMYVGVMSTTNRESSGSSDFECLPKEKQYYPGPTDSKEVEDIEDLPQIQPISFLSRKKGEDMKPKHVKCASCRVPGKSTTTMLSGQTECPEKWTKQYEGVLVSTEHKHVRGELICLDPSKVTEVIEGENEELTVITEASPDCRYFPCNDITQETAIPCVICSISKSSKSKSEVLRF